MNGASQLNASLKGNILRYLSVTNGFRLNRLIQTQVGAGKSKKLAKRQAANKMIQACIGFGHQVGVKCWFAETSRCSC